MTSSPQLEACTWCTNLSILMMREPSMVMLWWLFFVLDWLVLVIVRDTCCLVIFDALCLNLDLKTRQCPFLWWCLLLLFATANLYHSHKTIDNCHYNSQMPITDVINTYTWIFAGMKKWSTVSMSTRRHVPYHPLCLYVHQTLVSRLDSSVYT